MISRLSQVSKYVCVSQIMDKVADVLVDEMAGTTAATARCHIES